MLKIYLSDESMASKSQESLSAASSSSDMSEMASFSKVSFLLANDSNSDGAMGIRTPPSSPDYRRLNFTQQYYCYNCNHKFTLGSCNRSKYFCSLDCGTTSRMQGRRIAEPRPVGENFML